MPAPVLAKTAAGLLLAACGCGAQAVEWYTITGNKSDPGVDTTQIDASTLDRRETMLGLRFRVTLTAPRRMPNGEVYQSYISHIAVECATKSIFHEDQKRFREPLWQGPAIDETFVQPKPMAFARLSPDPRPLILAAACEPKPKNASR